MKFNPCKEVIQKIASSKIEKFQNQKMKMKKKKRKKKKEKTKKQTTQ